MSKVDDVSELVKRLTLNVPCWDNEGNKRRKLCGYDGVYCIKCRKKQDAADALEAQAAEIERLRAVLHLWRKNASEGGAT